MVAVLMRMTSEAALGMIAKVAFGTTAKAASGTTAKAVKKVNLTVNYCPLVVVRVGVGNGESFFDPCSIKCDLCSMIHLKQVIIKFEVVKSKIENDWTMTIHYNWMDWT